MRNITILFYMRLKKWRITVDKKLLPCPFCGRKAFIMQETFEVTVTCIGCGASSGNFFKDDEEAAIDAWNKRSEG